MYCDITLIVEDHKCVIDLLSPFCGKMFSIEIKKRFDIVKGVSKEVFEAILGLKYTGSITLNMKNIFGIIEAVHYMDLSMLRNVTRKF